MNGLTMEQQRKAVNFSVYFLREEVKSLGRLIESYGGLNQNMKKQAERRLSELQKDLEMFEALNDTLSL